MSIDTVREVGTVTDGDQVETRVISKAGVPEHLLADVGDATLQVEAEVGLCGRSHRACF